MHRIRFILQCKVFGSEFIRSFLNFFLINIFQRSGLRMYKFSFFFVQYHCLVLLMITVSSVTFLQYRHSIEIQECDLRKLHLLPCLYVHVH